jgi:hypothetical protein
VIKSQARIALMIEFVGIEPIGSEYTILTIENIRIIIPKIRHFVFLIPISPKIPARSVSTPTKAAISAPMSYSITAFITDRGE